MKKYLISVVDSVVLLLLVFFMFVWYNSLGAKLILKRTGIRALTKQRN